MTRDQHDITYYEPIFVAAQTKIVRGQGEKCISSSIESIFGITRALR